MTARGLAVAGVVALAQAVLARPEVRPQAIPVAGVAAALVALAAGGAFAPRW
ncbi:MAG: hypothetical protein Q4G64_02290 [bacterium]|nr:hypothetical protein [bacterium]